MILSLPNPTHTEVNTISEQPPILPDNLPNSDSPLLPSNPWRRTVVRIAALFLVLIFLLLIASSLLPLFGLPSLDFIMASRELSRDPKISSYMAAVAAVSAGRRGGTGFNIDSAGLFITNEHVIGDAAQVDLRLMTGDQYQVSDWLAFPESDLAFIDIEAENLPTLAVAIDPQTKTDDPVIIIGNPLGYFLIVVKASVLGMTTLSGLDTPVLVIRGPVFKGHSGSPVINSDGQVIGVIFAI